MTTVEEKRYKWWQVATTVTDNKTHHIDLQHKEWLGTVFTFEEIMECAETHQAELFLVLWHLLQHLREILDVGLKTQNTFNGG